MVLDSFMRSFALEVLVICSLVDMSHVNFSYFECF